MEILINGERVPANEIERERQTLRMRMQGAKPEDIDKQVQERVVNQTLLRQEANNKIDEVSAEDVEEEFGKLVESYGGVEKFHQQFRLNEEQHPAIKNDISQGMRIDRFIDQLSKDLAEPEDKAVREYYDKNSKQFIKPEEIHAAHIVKKPAQGNMNVTYNEMKTLRQELKEGANFAALANKHSECQDKDGDLGTFAPGKMVEEFDAILFSMEPGEISPVFLTKFGYHIATVYSRNEKEQLSFEDCAERIKKQMMDRERAKLVDQWIKDQKEKATIQII